MAYTVQDVIDEARERHRGFTDNQTPTRLLTKALDRYARRLRFKVQERDADRFSQTQVITFPLSDFDAGEALTDGNANLLGGTIHRTASTLKTELTIVPWKNRLRPGQGPAAYVLAGTIYFVGVKEDWEAVSTVDLVYVPEPTVLDDEADTVPLPDSSMDACVQHLAHFMAVRGPVADEFDIRLSLQLREDAARAESWFLDEITGGLREKTFVVREVW